MSYAICTAALHGARKANIEFTFPSAPSVAQVLSRATFAFSKMVGTEFGIAFAMVFDDQAQQWVPLEHSAQLVHNAQVYLFQGDTDDVPDVIPDPTPAGNLLGGYTSPVRSRDNLMGGTGGPMRIGIDNPSPPRGTYSGYTAVNATRASSTFSHHSAGGGGGGATAQRAGSTGYSARGQSAQSQYDASPRAAVPSNYSQRATFQASSPAYDSPARLAAQSWRATCTPGSLLHEARVNEEWKLTHEVDPHRGIVRGETDEFMQKEWSPNRVR